MIVYLAFAALVGVCLGRSNEFVRSRHATRDALPDWGESSAESNGAPRSREYPSRPRTFDHAAAICAHPDTLPHADASEEERLLLAIQKPQVTAAGTDEGTNYVTIEFKSGPNLGGQYGLACYGTEPDLEPLTCAELAGVEPEAVVDPQDLPKLYGNVANNVTGMESETVDCYVWADGISGKVDKCQFVDRVSDVFTPGGTWVLAQSTGTSCDTVCADQSSTCNVESLRSVVTQAQAEFVAAQVGIVPVSYVNCGSTSCTSANPFFSTLDEFGYNEEDALCDASSPVVRRVCCCGSRSCPLE